MGDPDLQLPVPAMPGTDVGVRVADIVGELGAQAVRSPFRLGVMEPAQGVPRLEPVLHQAHVRNGRVGTGAFGHFEFQGTGPRVGLPADGVGAVQLGAYGVRAQQGGQVVELVPEQGHVGIGVRLADLAHLQ